MENKIKISNIFFKNICNDFIKIKNIKSCKIFLNKKNKNIKLENINLELKGKNNTICKIIIEKNKNLQKKEYKKINNIIKFIKYYINNNNLNFQKIYKSEKINTYKNININIKNISKIANIGTWEYNFKNKYLTITKKILSIIIDNNNSEKIKLKEIFKLIDIKSKKDIVLKINNAIKTKKHFTIKLSINTKDNKIKWFKLTGKINKNKNIINGLIQDITTEQINEDYFSYLANHDELTNLPNRRNFSSQMDQFQKDNEDYIIGFIDIDYFKIINDKYGHQAGDKILKLLAQKMIDNLNKYFFISRIGGDEFSILSNKLCCIDLLKEKIKQFIEEINKEKIKIANEDINISISIGLYIVESRHNETRSEIMKKTDIALYQSKNKGKNCYTIIKHS